MPTKGFTFIDPEQARIDQQMQMANALRKQGMSGDTGAGMAGRVYVVGNPWGNIASAIGGQFLANQADKAQTALNERNADAEQQWLGQMPQATQSVDQFGPATPEGGSLPSVVTDKPLDQYADETRRWAMQAPNTVPGARQYALEQAMQAPQRMAELRDKAADRKAVLEATLAAKADQAVKERESRMELERLRQEGRMDLKTLAGAIAASNGSSRRDRFSLITNADGSVSRINMDTGELSPVEGVNRGAKPLSKSEQAVKDAGMAADNIDKLLAKAKESPESFGTVPAAASMLPNALASRITSKVQTSEQNQARNDVMRQAAIEVHKIYGSALSRGESSRADSWAINPTDNFETVMSKLNSARDYARSISGSSPAPAGKTVVREVPLKDGRTGVEYSDGSRGYK